MKVLIWMHLYILVSLLHLFLLKRLGELTLEEFIEGAKGHPDIMDMLNKLMDLTPVLVIIVEGRQTNQGKLGWVYSILRTMKTKKFPSWKTKWSLVVQLLRIRCSFPWHQWFPRWNVLRRTQTITVWSRWPQWRYKTLCRHCPQLNIDPLML